MATTIKGQQFDTNGRVVRIVHITFSRAYNPVSDSYTGDIFMHVAKGKQTFSISIPKEEWDKTQTVGQGRPSEAQVPHCRTHIEFRSDCTDCVVARGYF